ncbi:MULTISPECIES: UDP-3-O-(3-hydroxymyristoyl)glucosamine N-acyltransferase [Clostridium]|jgi:UDP-3-O-[3-hydroxymyristoyl] glucosamine N-acyltransferase|uniref:UDP-3-O-(3-hydroxymyristoyl)glucosamine N-acyltransferase n=1 Tax=Clostridium TaxID=1485 RepID=UPI00115B0B3C|nr:MULTISPECIES: UDP-3-O-(3-hydroxymyristoyl)glucosamine N-acyltransferase [Clostridium]MBS5308236.1 UDP-3-O-(3-hydroxymyristoyl)glucosamine N-acyltransferase [Clostridium sp.]MBS6501073.1 UDP-3-O-(3-hydroxymyristoyl)glucosamine N-acyltransferase [Clostridium sp.]MDB1940709.1 UDP-3-O-(3-hydroxymyristoyl)glucosamine N-acyltransferase [Clostridium tertium]MDB1945396.1 UDP-3-O-(3-hydroxymyristoyl)glucosamine N-acyltransferase [Clostridium tertium]MDB1951881.1 UDP-3-O-(3-hydroxymyristoyl)glucosami
MLLSEVVQFKEGLDLLKDGEFTSLGLAVSVCEEKLLSFIENEKYIDSLSDRITCLITTKAIGEKLKNKYGVIVSSNPRMDYFKLHNKLSSIEEYKRKEFETIIGEGCEISNLASISKNNVRIGNNVKIEEFVVIRENTVIEDNSIIRAGVVLGGEGYEYKRVDGIIMNVNHCGGVIIGESVEVQYNGCIDKALYPWDNTIIGSHSKLDNLVHIEHGVKIGNRCLIASRTTFGGRTIIGDDSWVGLGAIISNGLTLGNKVSVSLGSVVTKSLKDGEKVSGNFAINHNKYIDFIKSIR